MSVVTYAAAKILGALPRNAISRAMGALCEARVPSPVLQPILSVYGRAYDVAWDEASPSDQPYASFDAFFTRRLRPGLRPIDGDEDVLVSPADGRLVDLGRSDGRGALMVKGRPYTVEELVGDRTLARDLTGGGFAVVYLSPRDYHRVHSPVSGTIRRVRAIDGDRWPVNEVGERHVPRLFVKNRRVVVEIDTPNWGRVAVVLVGAMIVGRMTVVGIDQPDVAGVHEVSPGRPIARGEELGAFHLGSTVVLLVPPDRFAGFSRDPEPVRYGQSLGRARALGGATS